MLNVTTLYEIIERVAGNDNICYSHPVSYTSVKYQPCINLQKTTNICEFRIKNNQIIIDVRPEVLPQYIINDLGYRCNTNYNASWTMNCRVWCNNYIEFETIFRYALTDFITNRIN